MLIGHSRQYVRVTALQSITIGFSLYKFADISRGNTCKYVNTTATRVTINYKLG